MNAITEDTYRFVEVPESYIGDHTYHVMYAHIQGGDDYIQGIEIGPIRDGFIELSLTYEHHDKGAGLYSWTPRWEDVYLNLNHVTHYRRVRVRPVTYKEYQDLIKEEEE